MFITRPYWPGLVAASIMVFPLPALSNGSRIDKIYHPYVQPLERELEFRVLNEDNASVAPGDRTKARVGYGQAVSDNWFAEGYLIGEKNDDRNFHVQSFEVEGIRQLTEQGEYTADAGLLFDVESKFDGDLTEFSSAFLLEKEWGHWSGTANLFAIYEFGRDVNNELETALNLQGRYRYSRYFEPAVEFYKAQNTFGIGPVMLGGHSFGRGNKLHWEAGLIIGLDNDTPDRTLRGLLEFDF